LKKGNALKNSRSLAPKQIPTGGHWSTSRSENLRVHCERSTKKGHPMKAKHLMFHEEARDKIRRGVDALA
jgi:hypothetical protein